MINYLNSSLFDNVMELKFLENKKNRVVLEIDGAGHTFCNILKKELWNDDSVKSSAYSVDHPLVGIPKVVVETKSGSDASKALVDAATRLEKENKDFLSKLKKAL